MRFLYGHTLRPTDAHRFRRTLRALRNRFEFVTMAHAVELSAMATPPSGRYLAFSFDDGFRDNYEIIAPLLDQFGARACFFVTTNFIECDDAYRAWFLRERLRADPAQQPMTWAMLAELAAAGFDVGAHTADHPDLAALPEEAALAQITSAADTIETRLGRRCELFAWPYGTAAHFPSRLLARLDPRFRAVFSAIRSRRLRSYDGRVINRDHFEPAWPTRHVLYFACRGRADESAAVRPQLVRRRPARPSPSR